MNDKFIQWLKQPDNLLASMHGLLVLIGAVATSHLHWSLWLIVLLAATLAALPALGFWLEKDVIERIRPVVHGVLSALWGLAFFSVFSVNWPIILFVLATLVLAYLLITDLDFSLRAAGIIPASLAAAGVLLINGHYLSAIGLVMLAGLALWHAHWQENHEEWNDTEDGSDETEASFLPVAPPVGPDPEAEAEIAALKNRIRTLETDLSSAEMAKMEFLATMSHEIRTPLNGIIPLLDILLDSELSDFQKDYLQTAFVSAKQMQKLIDDLLDYSKVEAGKLSIENVGLKLPRVLESVIKALEPSAKKKGLDIRLDVSPYISPLLRGDPLRVRQVVTNLLSNAIKFSDRGTITVRAEKIRDLGNHELIRISVQDQGIGMDEEQQAVLFQPFTQVDGSSTRKFGGTGIGLAISKKIVELMDGRISVESAKGKGSTFTIELPLLKPAHQTATTKEPQQQTDYSGPSFQAVILNTSFSATQSWQQQLSAQGIHVKPSNSLSHIQESLNAARQLSGKRFHFLVFVDFDTAPKQARAMIAELMSDEAPDDLTLCIITAQQRIAGVPRDPRIQLLSPSTSATELLQRLYTQSSESPAANTPQATSTRPDSRQPAFGGLALDDAETEPAASEPPTDEAAKTTENYQQAPAGKQPRPPLDERVLLVEDNDVNLKVAQKLIQYIGYTYDVAKNGLEALEKVKQHRYRMILMDCQMPVMDGYLCTRRIREYEKAEGLNNTPIIAMTANAMMGDREKCLAAGMDDYMSKPLNRYVLEKTLKKWDPMQKTPTPASPANQTSQSANTGSPTINNKWLSTKTLREIRGFMGDDVQQLLHMFKQDAPGILRHMRKALQSGDLAELRTQAHSLKSASANIGARGLSYFCKRMEAEALSGDMARLNALMENIKKSYLLTVREIDKYDQPRPN